MDITFEYVAAMRQTLLRFHDETGAFLKLNEGLNVPTSQFSLELSKCANPESIISASGIANVLIEHGAEHLTAFVKLVTQPPELIASWTCVRSMLESCALSAWLLDPSIDAETRMTRVFALRHEGIVQELKFGRAAKRPANEIATAEANIDRIIRTAASYGVVLPAKKPGPTAMIKMMLDEEAKYCLLSAVAHGHFWAINGLSYKQLDTGDITIAGIPTKPIEKTVNLTGIASLGLTTFRALAKPLWNQCRFMGWDQLKLEELIENAADGLGMGTQLRFWRS